MSAAAFTVAFATEGVTDIFDSTGFGPRSFVAGFFVTTALAGTVFDVFDAATVFEAGADFAAEADFDAGAVFAAGFDFGVGVAFETEADFDAGADLDAGADFDAADDFFAGTDGFAAVFAFTFAFLSSDLSFLPFLSDFFVFSDAEDLAEPALAAFNFSLSDFDLVLEAFFLSGLAI